VLMYIKLHFVQKLTGTKFRSKSFRTKFYPLVMKQYQAL
jgi:hypothetical protein